MKAVWKDTVIGIMLFTVDSNFLSAQSDDTVVVEVEWSRRPLADFPI